MSVQRFSSASLVAPQPKNSKNDKKNSAINNQQHKNLLNNGKRREKKLHSGKKNEFNFIQRISSTQSIYTRESSDREYIKLPESARFKLSQEHRERKQRNNSREKKQKMKSCGRWIDEFMRLVGRLWGYWKCLSKVIIIAIVSPSPGHAALLFRTNNLSRRPHYYPSRKEHISRRSKLTQKRAAIIHLGVIWSVCASADLNLCWKFKGFNLISLLLFFHPDLVQFESPPSHTRVPQHTMSSNVEGRFNESHVAIIKDTSVDGGKLKRFVLGHRKFSRPFISNLQR